MGLSSATLAELDALTARIDAKNIELGNSINANIGKLPDWIQKKIVEAVVRLWALVDKLRTTVIRVLASPGDPDKLQDAAREWNDKVGQPSSAQSGGAQLNAKEVDNWWDGPAKIKYGDLLPPQNFAMRDITTVFTTTIAKGFKDLATAIKKLWVAMAVAFGALIAGLIGAVTSAGTLVGLPAAPFIAAGAVVVCIIAIITGMDTLRSDCDGIKTDLNGALTNVNSYYDDHWPKATVY